MLENTIQSVLIRHGINKSNPLLVAVSGGADSVALLNALIKMNMNVSVAHFNHQIRPSSDKEMEFVRSLAQQYGLKFYVKSQDTKKIAAVQKRGLEETARKERYHFLFSVAEANNQNAVLTAHHADDQVETVLFNFARGSGMPGLIGIHPFSYMNKNFSIPLIRPMLGCWKKDILAYCQEYQLQYVMDESNDDISFSRNFVRHEIIPNMEKLNSNFKENIIQTVEILNSDLDYIKSSVNEASNRIILNLNADYVELDLAQFCNQPVSIQRFILKENLDKRFPRPNGYSFKQIENCRLTLLGDYQSGFYQITDDLCVFVESGSGFLARSLDIVPLHDKPGIENEVVVEEAGALKLNKWWILDSQVMIREIAVANGLYSNTDPFTAYIDFKKNHFPFVIRSAKPGDTYAAMGLGGRHTKVSDCFINRKIPRRFREKWPLICSNEGKIIWIPGYQPSHYAMIDENSVNVLKLEVKKSINV